MGIVGANGEPEGICWACWPADCREAADGWTSAKATSTAIARIPPAIIHVEADREPGVDVSVPGFLSMGGRVFVGFSEALGALLGVMLFWELAGACFPEGLQQPERLRVFSFYRGGG